MVAYNPHYDRVLYELPPFEKVLHSSFLAPFLTYFAFFRLASLFVKTFMWQSYSGFKKYRLQNLSICLLHSTISGLWSTLFFLTHIHDMFENVTYYYETWAAQLPIISVAYFTHDALDMLNHEWSRWTLELLLHHIATCLALLTGLLARRFLLADYWAILMEGNSIFLHTRTIMQISGLSLQQPDLFKRIVRCNVISFVIFRFISQAIYVRWALTQINKLHPFYVSVAVGGPAIFLIINGMLFFRILVSDGYLDKRWKARAAINRDDDKDDPKTEKKAL
ncbi:unnamed protein product [Cylicocyclus nassatus]|uniref:TLC domain-containing protein n=1 Tax=Cylicocyclus nassatus TaxID=53992 RepID=A0AA36H281_CYLNA|nr:unnamed protein product [Cylicocyclus nassatus]